MLKVNAAYINTFYYPDESERYRLEKLQDEFNMIHAELSYSLRDCKGYELWFRKEVFRQKFRERSIHLVQ